ncbi:MAG TPA: ribosome silencing factor [Bacillota bacterium]|nr:ribosome silencing factor [Bacillota bacterium]
MDTKDVLELVAEACDDRRAENIIALNMEQVSLVADYFLICHGNSERQVQAIAKSILDELDEQEMQAERVEGYRQGRWILIDIGDVVCHIFHKDERYHYNLERLWGDAPRVSLVEVGKEE